MPCLGFAEQRDQRDQRGIGIAHLAEPAFNPISDLRRKRSCDVQGKND
jgi:hypothetical protein